MLAAKHNFEAIGTQWIIETPSPLSAAMLHRIDTCIQDFSASYSRFDAQSQVHQLYRTTTATFPDSLRILMGVYDTLCGLTDGRVNPLVGGALENLGYDAAYSLQQRGPAHPSPDLSILQRSGTVLMTSEPVLLDIGAIGKGFLVDELSAIISTEHDEYVVDGSGDLRVCATTPQRVGLEDPRDTRRVLGHVDLLTGSLCASATNRRVWGENLHHVIDATTGLPADTTIIATWAITHDAIIADALTTGLFFVPPEKLAAEFGAFRYAMLDKDGTLHHNLETMGEIY